MGFVSTQRLVQRGPPTSAAPTLLPSQTAEEKKKKPWVNKLSSIHCREGNATVVFMKRKYILGWGKSMQPPTMRMMLICLFFFKVSRHFSFTLEIIVCFYNPPGLTFLSLESSANCSPCVISFEPSDFWEPGLLRMVTVKIWVSPDPGSSSRDGPFAESSRLPQK